MAKSSEDVVSVVERGSVVVAETEVCCICSAYLIFDQLTLLK
jgi:hypothetical protein